jgi:hypothetical protein
MIVSTGGGPATMIAACLRSPGVRMAAVTT